MMPPPYSVRVRTSYGWQDIALQGPQGPPGPAGASPSMMGYTYVDSGPALFSMGDSVVPDPVATGEITIAPSQTTATTISVATVSGSGTDVTVPIEAIKNGDTVYLTEVEESDCRQVYLVTDSPTSYGNYADIPVEWVGSGPHAPLTSGEEVFVGVVRVGETGPAGPSGDSNYIHTQPAPSATWTIAHNLGKYPSATVVDTGGTVIEPDVLYIDENTVTVSFGSATSGKAYLN